jgi:pyruvate kinase
MKNKINAIVTIPPYAPFIDEVVAHPIVGGLRLNTVMPTKGSLEELLQTIKKKAKDKELWLDLKTRQLRVKDFGVPPFTEITLTHEIEVKTPTTAYFNDGKEYATVLEIDKNRLIMQEGPRRVIGPGESVNIPDETLNVKGYFTVTDLSYIKAAKEVGIKNIMLSFVESKNDLNLINKIYPDANLALKIESKKGLFYANHEYKKEHGTLMAARGDLYVEIRRPHEIISAVEDIISKDKNAIAASRIFPSLAYNLEPNCEDIGDFDNLLRMGYKNFMLGDDICQRRESVINALNLFEVIAKKYQK